MHNDQYDFDDYGLSIDVALALDTADEQLPTVQAVGDRLAKHVEEYTAPGFGTVTSAGSTAKAVALAGAVGADPNAFGGTDLVAQLETTVTDSGPARGRIQDVLDPKEAAAADYANVVGQAYAVLGLTGVESPEAGPAADFLVAQQCADGWFRLDFTKDVKAADQSCEGDRTSKPDLDTTAFAIRALRLSDSAQASRAVNSAVAWLSEQQAPDGSFDGGSTASTPNTNSTGLAGTALGEAGETEAAERAATWVFGRQALDCQKVEPAVVGAIAYDDAGAAAAVQNGIGVKTADQFRRASAGALPVLQWLPERETADQNFESC
ncbi:MAG: prenyltransferase/squalene oxidase repeat-containing protein [Nocardioides sp.]